MAGCERQFDNAKRVRVADFAVGSRKAKWIVTASPGPHYNLSYSIGWIGVTLGILRRKAFVGMLMPGQHQRRVRTRRDPPTAALIPGEWRDF